MTCERYWTDGILLVEQGQPDPHRDGCADCQREHARRNELVGALPLVNAMRTGDPRWKERVWREIDGRASVQRAWIGGGMVAAAAAALVLWFVLRPGPSEVVADRPEIEIISGKVAMRSTSARVGDTVRVNVRGEEVRFYRAERLFARCEVDAPVCEQPLATAGEYQIDIVSKGAPTPTGTLDRDNAAVIDRGLQYRPRTLSVR